MKKITFIIAALLLCLGAQAKLSVRNLCSDGMVLQQQTQATVWGWADANAQVSVTPSWSGKTYSCKADKKGIWKVSVDTPAASYTNYSIAVKSGKEKLTINDVLIGEVWLSSGQSNMQIPIKGFTGCPIENCNEVVTQAPARDKIRMFTVPHTQSLKLEDDVEGQWDKADPNTIPDMSAVSYFFARKLNQVLDVPIGMVNCPFGGSRVEMWIPKEILATYGTEDLSDDAVNKKGRYDKPFVAYNAMINPIKGYTIKGFIWYQGCSNVGKHDQFVPRMTNMIRIFRECFGDTGSALPFYEVEIAPYVYDRRNPDGDSGALLRRAQHEVANVVPNAACVVTNDLVASYEKTNIHPSRKEPIGNRLAYLALNRDYGFKNVLCYSPEATEITQIEMRRFGPPGMQQNSDQPAPKETVVKLIHCESGLNRTAEIEGLEACGEDGVWVKVDAASFDGNGYLHIRSEAVPSPVGIRYGWGDYKPGNLANCEGLPVAPFCLKLND